MTAKEKDETKFFRGKPGPGRPKGMRNRATIAARIAISEAFEKLGGVESLVKWAKKNDDNRKIFYSQIWPKIVPLQLSNDPENPMTVTLIELIAPVAQKLPPPDIVDVYLAEPGEGAD